MEPIRPDDDELRAETPIGSTPKKPEPAGNPASSGKGGAWGEGGGKNRGRSGDKPVASTPKPPTSGANGGGQGGGRPWGLWLMLILVAVVAAGGWFSQSRQIEALEGQLEEADYWARQSKLALARFEGDLSETGENLEERGQSIEQKLEDQEGRLDSADSEIRKLWAIANERNKKRLDDHQARLDTLAEGMKEEVAAREELAASVGTLESSLSGELEELQADLSQQITALKESTARADQRLTELNSALEGVDQLVDRRIQRFEREQELGIDGRESRISALERSLEDVADGSAVNSVRTELNRLKETVESIDASRSQLTSRLIRLSEQVDSLRSQSAGQ